ncbi:MAG: hypothetical protein P4L87_21090, partial [Formivibrio sp.]|nr:hypothetical protein [Formivibrio sp.]
MGLSITSGVHFYANLPLSWQPDFECIPFESARYLAVLAEFEHALEDRPQEQAQLHAKLDLLLLWLARSLSKEIPASRKTWIGLEAMSWESAVPLVVSDVGAVALNLSDALPFLLQLPATITACEQAGEIWRVDAQLIIKDENLRDWWERTVFR